MLSAFYKQALHIDLNRNWGKFPSANAAVVPARSSRKNFVFFLKPLRPHRAFFGTCPHFAPFFSIHRLAWSRRGQCPSPFRQRYSPKPSSSFHKRLFSLKNRPTSEEPGGALPGSDCEHVIHIRFHSVCGLDRLSRHWSGAAWIKAFSVSGGDRKDVPGSTFA